jgi:hypothetical protein
MFMFQPSVVREEEIVVKRNLKLLYLLTLGALCLCVTTGPAEAGFSIINNGGPISYANAWFESTSGGILNVSSGPNFAPSSGDRVDLGLDVSCGTGGGTCAATVGFGFSVSAPGSITVDLSGWSSDPAAEGEVRFPVAQEVSFSLASVALYQTWDVNSDFQLSMDPFTVPVEAGWYFGQFTITSLAEGGYVNLGEKSLDFTYNSSAVPEPGSALLLGAGIAFVAFLRRKSRR